MYALMYVRMCVCVCVFRRPSAIKQITCVYMKCLYTTDVENRWGSHAKHPPPLLGGARNAQVGVVHGSTPTADIAQDCLSDTLQRRSAGMFV